MRDSKFTKLEEKKFRRDNGVFLKDADNIKTHRKISRIQEISLLEEGCMPDLKEKEKAEDS